MKILQVNASYKPAYIYGGPTMSVSMLSEQLVKAGVKVTVFTTTANGMAELPVAINKLVDIDNVSVRYFKRITKDHTHFSPALLKALWKNVRHYDVVHIHAWWNLVSVLSCAIAIIRKVPVLLSPRGTLSTYSFSNKSISQKKIMQKLGGKKLLNKCHIHVTSKAEGEAISHILKPKSINILPNFVKLDKPLSNKNRPKTDYLKLLFFSRIEEKKGLDILLDALPMLTIPFKLTIAGSGDETYTEKLKSRVNSSIADNIDWIGFQNESKFTVFYEHDLLILPSYNENFGNVVIESLSVGTPVLVSEHVGLANYVKDNNLGFICDTTPNSISNKINAIGNNLPALERIRQQAPQIITDDFNTGKLAQQYINLYNFILGA